MDYPEGLGAAGGIRQADETGADRLPDEFLVMFVPRDRWLPYLAQGWKLAHDLQDCSHGRWSVMLYSMSDEEKVRNRPGRERDKRRVRNYVNSPYAPTGDWHEDGGDDSADRDD